MEPRIGAVLGDPGTAQGRNTLQPFLLIMTALFRASVCALVQHVLTNRNFPENVYLPVTIESVLPY